MYTQCFLGARDSLSSRDWPVRQSCVSAGESKAGAVCWGSPWEQPHSSRGLSPKAPCALHAGGDLHPQTPCSASSLLMDNHFRLLLHLAWLGNGLWKQRTLPAMSLCPTELPLLGGPRNFPPSDPSHHPWPLISLRSSAISVCFP